MPPAQSVRILGSSGLIGSSAWWWMSNRRDNSIKNVPQTNSLKQELTHQDKADEIPFSGASIDHTIRRGGW
jgi:hypothetical protein